jgi:hypothetical protein
MRLLLFDSVHRVMQAESRLKAAGIRHELLPTPKEHSAECGMCIGVARSEEAAAGEVLGRLVRSVVDAPGEVAP